MKYLEFDSIKEAVIWSELEAERRGCKAQAENGTIYWYQAWENEKTLVASIPIPEVDVALLSAEDQKKLKAARPGDAADWATTVMEPKP